MSAFWNGEKYYDPTAGAAIADVERQNRKRYVHGGVKVFDMDGICKVVYTEYLPCNLQKATCIIPMIRHYGTEQDIQYVTNYLVQFMNEQDLEQSNIAAELMAYGNAGMEGSFKKRRDKSLMLQRWTRQNLAALLESGKEEEDGNSSR